MRSGRVSAGAAHDDIEITQRDASQAHLTNMTIQKSPHTQTQQDTMPEPSDLKAGERAYETDFASDQSVDKNAEGAETGTNRSPRETDMRNARLKMEPEVEAHEEQVATRKPKRPSQGTTSHSAEEKSATQKKVVNERPDAQAGVNWSKVRSKRKA